MAAAAYRSGERLVDERTGNLHDYTRRGGVVYTAILTQDGQGAERNQLWNAAEEAEKRKDARTAREWVIALPHELDAKQRQALAVEFGQALVDIYGVAADVAIHKPDKEGDNRNHHAHILTTTRQVSRNQAGELVMGEKSDIELSDKKRRSLGLEDAASEIMYTRKLWERMANRALEKAGQEARIDCRSLKAQGLEQQPTIHMGPMATDMERRGIRTDRGDINRSVKASNDELKQVSAEVIVLKEVRDLKAEAIREARRKAAEQEEQRKQEAARQEEARIKAEIEAQKEKERRDQVRYEVNKEHFKRRNLEVIKAQEIIDQCQSRQQANEFFQKYAERAVNAYVDVVLASVVASRVEIDYEYRTNDRDHRQFKENRQAIRESMTACDENLTEWRLSHPVKSWLHDKGWWQSKEIKDQEKEYVRLERIHKGCVDNEQKFKERAEKALEALQADARKQVRAEAVALIENEGKLNTALKEVWKQDYMDDKRTKATEGLLKAREVGLRALEAEEPLKAKEIEAQRERERRQQEQEQRMGYGRGRGRSRSLGRNREGPDLER